MAGFRTACALIVGCSLLVGASTSLEAQSFVRGDASGDGVVDFSDAITLISAVGGVQGLSVAPLDRADVNDNEIVSYLDYFMIMGFLFNGSSSAPSSPYPFAGDDLDDTLGTLAAIQPGFSVELSVLEITPEDLRIAIRPIAPGEVRSVQFQLALPGGVARLRPT